jgi:anti-anti-sigma factor
MFVQVFHYSPLAVGLGSSESTESDGRISVATVTGDVDESVRAEFSHTLADAVDDTSNAVVIDLSHVDFLGVSGALALAEVQVRSDLRHRGLLLVPGSPVFRTLTVMGLLESFRCFPSVQEAVTALRTDEASVA